jgi:endonuclease/exonuclease/phosphatase family metal-dependent hydrolase
MTGSGSLRVLTMNVLGPAQADWPHRRELIRTALGTVRADVLALQEITVDDAADLLGEAYSLLPHPGADADGMGAVLASRWPARRLLDVDLHVTARVALPWSAAVLAQIDLPAPIGPVVVVHCKPTWEAGAARERELQAVATARAVEQELAGDDRHVILLGDLDEGPDGASLRFWTGRQSLEGMSVAYRDAWEVRHPDAPGWTFTPANPLVARGEMPLETGRRIDHVLVRCAPHGPTLQVVDCALVLDGPVAGVWASDHFGVVATLAPPPHPLGSWA